MGDVQAVFTVVLQAAEPALCSLLALSVQSPGSDSWSKPVNTFNGTEPSTTEVSGT